MTYIGEAEVTSYSCSQPLYDTTEEKGSPCSLSTVELHGLPLVKAQSLTSFAPARGEC